MAMASKGQTGAHFAQPVQPGASCRTARLFPMPSGRSACSHSTWGGQTATQRPQPVQRSRAIWGSAMAGTVLVLETTEKSADGSLRGSSAALIPDDSR
jgi:hypothetical protein